MKNNFLKTCFYNKRNIFLSVLSFVIVFLITIFSTVANIDITKESAYIDFFPDNLAISSNVKYSELNDIIDTYYSNCEHFEVYKTIVNNGSTNIFSDNADEKFLLEIYGIDNNFLKTGIDKDDDKKLKFSAFSTNEKYFSNDDIQYGAMIFYSNKNVGNMFESGLNLNGFNLKFYGLIESKFKDSNSLLKIFIPLGSFYDIFIQNESDLKQITVDIYSNVTHLKDGNDDLLTKKKLVSTYNAKITDNNNEIVFLLFLLIFSSISVVILVSFSIRNRHNEIGIKLAVGAKKIDVALEFTGETFKVSLVGILLGFICGIYLDLLISLIYSILYKINVFSFNIYFSIFGSCITLLTFTICSLLCCLLVVRNNIESILKEER